MAWRLIIRYFNYFSSGIFSATSYWAVAAILRLRYLTSNKRERA
jgi:hypothetical protein